MRTNKNSTVRLYYLGSVNYNPKGTSWKGLGADRRNTFYSPEMKCGYLRNSHGEFCVVPKNSRIGMEIEKLFYQRMAEGASIRPMTKEEKRFHLKHCDNIYKHWIINKGIVFRSRFGKISTSVYNIWNGGECCLELKEYHIDSNILIQLKKWYDKRAEADGKLEKLDKKLEKILERN